MAEQTSLPVAQIAARLMRHPDPDVRAVAASALTQYDGDNWQPTHVHKITGMAYRVTVPRAYSQLDEVNAKEHLVVYVNNHGDTFVRTLEKFNERFDAIADPALLSDAERVAGTRARKESGRAEQSVRSPEDADARVPHAGRRG